MTPGVAGSMSTWWEAQCRCSCRRSWWRRSGGGEIVEWHCLPASRLLGSVRRERAVKVNAKGWG
eukprot:scaffold11704_cov72-Phaeocystis_antarctica.AAC.2